MTVLAALLVVATAGVGRLALAVGRSHLVRLRLRGERAMLGGAFGGRVAAVLPAPPSWVATWLDRAGIEVAAKPAWWGAVTAVAALTLAALVAVGPGVAALVGIIAVTVPLVALRTRRHHGDERLEHALPAALEAVARSLRSGASLRQAVGEAAVATPGALGRELGVVARQAAHGATLVDALEALALRRPTPGVRLAVTALCLGVETGGAQARAVDGVAATLRDRLAVAGEVRALSSQARMSALVIGLAPLAFGAFAVTTDPRTGHLLFHSPVGIALVAVGVTLDGLGWLWMQHLARVPA